MIPLRRPRLFPRAVPAHPACAAGVRHASADPADLVSVVLKHSGRDLRVTFAEPSPGSPRSRAVGPVAESERGLRVVCAPGEDRGTDPPEPGDVGETVWFALAAGEPM